MNLFISTLFTQPWSFVVTVVLVVFSVTCHEYVHAATALRLGDSTAADRGHLTLNPLRQMGWFSLAALMLFGLAWGMVPVNPSRLRGRYSASLVAAAGPATNVGLALVFCILSAVVRLTGLPDSLFSFTVLGAVLNFALAILNLLPVPGLDGFAVMMNLFPGLFRAERSEFFKGAIFVGIALVFLFVRYIFVGATWLTGMTLAVLLRLCGGGAA
ncbi:MAG: site-2 protease family protein [Victivallaceae bacterium]|nr:site-2 protease family protein [Victivallaceae bacterium]